jgi:hypothetical protein
LEELEDIGHNQVFALLSERRHLVVRELQEARLMLGRARIGEICRAQAGSGPDADPPQAAKHEPTSLKTFHIR